MRTKNLIIFMAATAFLSACGSMVPVAPYVIERDGIDSISATADLQTTYIKKHGHTERYCAARPSDVAATSSEGVGLGSSVLGNKESIGESATQGQLSLGGRNPEVLIARELLYRACELSMNINSNTEETMGIYKMFLKAITLISKSQVGVGSSTLGLNGEKIDSSLGKINLGGDSAPAGGGSADGGDSGSAGDGSADGGDIGPDGDG